jgi:hypothetical protein
MVPAVSNIYYLNTTDFVTLVNPHKNAKVNDLKLVANAVF